MADEETGLTESAVAESSASVESAPEPGQGFPELDAVLAQDWESPAEAVKDADGDDFDESDEVASEQSADDSASKPEDAPAGGDQSKPLSRREQRELERRQEIEAATTKATQAEEALSKIQAEQGQTAREALASLGDDARFNELHEKYEAYKKIGYVPEDYMDVDELAEYQKLLPQRQHAAALMGIARQAIRAQDQAALTAVVKEFGLEPAQYVGVDPSSAIKNAITATEARVRGETADRIAQLEASEQSLATKLGGRGKSVGPGGQSDSSGRHGIAWDPQKRGADNLEEALTSWVGQGDA